MKNFNQIKVVAISLACVFLVSACGSEPQPQPQPQPEIPKTPACDNIYTRGQELGRGGCAIVYSATVPTGGSVDWVVKEHQGSEESNDSALGRRAAQMGVGPEIFKSGLCTREKLTYSYKIEKRMFPVTIEFVENHQESFDLQINNLLDALHANSMTHGDMHLGNILYDDVNKPRFYLTDFDKGLDLTVVPLAERQGHIDFEKFATRDMLAGNYYPPGGWPAGAEKSKTNRSILKVWQTQIFKWRKADLNLDGEISDGEARTLSDRIGSATLARIAQETYNLRVKDLTPDERAGFLADKNLDGKLSASELDKLSVTFPTAVKISYERFADDLKSKADDYGITGTDRIVSQVGRYASDPLLASQILIISGGDITPSRQFPKKTAIHNQEFVWNMGYRFESFAGSLAGWRKPYWSKVFMLLDKLENPQNRVVVWFDDDGVVSPMSDMIERYLNSYLNEEIIVAMDPEQYAYLNTGVMIVRNSKDSKDLLVEMLRVGAEERELGGETRSLMTWRQDTACLHEQQALQELVLGVKIGRRWEYQSKRNVRRNWDSMVAVVPQYDSVTGQNMNFFSVGTFDAALKGRYLKDSNDKKTYLSAAPPFFVQCAGPNLIKDECVDNLLKWTQDSRRWW